MLDHGGGSSGGHHLIEHLLCASFPILYMYCHLIPAAALWVLLSLFTDEETEVQRNELPKFISS